ncbi:MAG: hypothetical protein JWM95_3020 [Gemmatimonadetes bacterium]|nr:hypothetical protein [Gemmatimonadota bacterium]
MARDERSSTDTPMDERDGSSGMSDRGSSTRDSSSDRSAGARNDDGLANRGSSNVDELDDSIRARRDEHYGEVY